MTSQESRVTLDPPPSYYLLYVRKSTQLLDFFIFLIIFHLQLLLSFRSRLVQGDENDAFTFCMENINTNVVKVKITRKKKKNHSELSSMDCEES